MNILTESRIEEGDTESRWNNLIFKGIKHSSTDNLSEITSDFYSWKLDISVEYRLCYTWGSI